MTHPLRLYGHGLLRAREQAGARAALRLRDGTVVPLPLDLYLGPPDEIELSLLGGVQGPVLDVGCGPGRHLHALLARGVFALGVDLSPAAVELATEHGARAVATSVFDDLPGAGWWHTALLLDGNIGIGGHPARLLRRICSLVREEGEVLVELGAPEDPTETLLARIEIDDQISSWFPWARVSVSDVDEVAGAAGFDLDSRWAMGGRWFARLRRKARARIPSLDERASSRGRSKVSPRLRTSSEPAG